MKKTRRLKRQGCIFLVLVIIMLTQFLGIFSALNITIFNNSLATENLTFTGNQNITRYLQVPQNAIFTSGYLNLSGYLGLAGIGYTSLCYQEFSNKTTACGGLNTGNYGGELGIWEDGDWSTCEVIIGAGENHTHYTNYSIPSGALNNSIFTIGITNNQGVMNYTVPQTCWDTGKLDFKIYNFEAGYRGHQYFCRNSTDYQLIASINAGGSGEFCEEAMYWNMTQYYYPTNISLTTGSNLSYNFTGQFNQTNNRTNSLSNYVNSYLLGCTYTAGYCYIPFLFHSDTPGTLQYSNLDFSDNEFNFGYCNTTLKTPYINFTFKDETTLQNINASISSSWTYYISSVSTQKSYSFTNNTDNPSYSFCFSPNLSVTAIPTLTYDAVGYAQRSYTSTFTLTNSTNNTVLYLLSTADGQYVTFQVLNQADQAVSGATIEIYQGGILFESRTTDSAGTATFFMNPLLSYRIDTSKTGYDSASSTISPTQTTYTIYLGGTGTTNLTSSYSRGLTYLFAPTPFELNNNTIYNFNFTLVSSYWDLQEFGFVLRNLSGYVFSTQSMVANSGTVDANVNTGLNQFLRMDAYWLINGTYTNVSKTWYIINSNDTQYSIKNFFDRLRTYMNDPADSDGLFGLKGGTGNFSLTLIIFVVIFAIAGTMSYKFGLTSTGAILMVIFALTYLADGILNLVPRIGDAPVATILVGIILVVNLIKENT